MSDEGNGRRWMAAMQVLADRNAAAAGVGTADFKTGEVLTLPRGYTPPQQLMSEPTHSHSTITEDDASGGIGHA